MYLSISIDVYSRTVPSHPTHSERPRQATEGHLAIQTVVSKGCLFVSAPSLEFSVEALETCRDSQGPV